MFGMFYEEEKVREMIMSLLVPLVVFERILIDNGLFDPDDAAELKKNARESIEKEFAKQEEEEKKAKDPTARAVEEFVKKIFGGERR